MPDVTKLFGSEYDPWPAADLASFSTIKIGGVATLAIYPKSSMAMCKAMAECQRHGVPAFVVGKGSNILWSDSGFDGVVVSTRRCEYLMFVRRMATHTIFRASAGESNQQLIRFAESYGAGGIEFLSSVPGTVGGAVYMNAGRSADHPDQQFGRFIERVEVFDGSAIRRISQKECRFSFRRSVFHEHPDWLILSADIRLPNKAAEDVKRGVRARMSFVRDTQDSSLPNLGSIFRCGHPRLRELMGKRVGGASWSELTPNWIVNHGGASSADVLQLIESARSSASTPLELEIITPPFRAAPRE